MLSFLLYNIQYTECCTRVHFYCTVYCTVHTSITSLRSMYCILKRVYIAVYLQYHLSHLSAPNSTPYPTWAWAPWTACSRLWWPASCVTCCTWWSRRCASRPRRVARARRPPDVGGSTCAPRSCSRSRTTWRRRRSSSTRANSRAASASGPRCSTRCSRRACVDSTSLSCWRAINMNELIVIALLYSCRTDWAVANLTACHCVSSPHVLQVRLQVSPWRTRSTQSVPTFNLFHMRVVSS